MEPTRVADAPDERDRTWTANTRAFALFVATVLVLLSLPTLDDPLPVRLGRGLVRILEWVTGTEFGPLSW